MNLQREELVLLELLTWKIRVATAKQLASFREGSEARLQRLITGGLIRSASLVVAVVPVGEPLYRWHPGDAAPNFAALSHQLVIRRERTEPAHEKICWAAPRAVHIVGGSGGRLRQPHQVEHDLGVTQVYLLRGVPDDASGLCWLGEDCYRKLHGPRGKIPDAVLCDSRGNVQLAIEYGGLYPAVRLRRFHQHCARKRLPYEIW